MSRIGQGRLSPAAIIALLLLLPSAPGTTSADEPIPDGWRFTVAPYAWALGIKGEVGIGSLDADIDATFLDILDQSDSLVALQGHIEAQKNRFGVFFDGIYADIGVKYDGSFISLDVDQKMAIIEGGGFYRVIDEVALWQQDASRAGEFSADALVGVRYTSLEVDLDSSVEVFGDDFERRFEGRRDWIDPIVGGRVELRLTEDIDVALRADVGGFGVGSDFTWNTQGLLGYRFQLFGKAAAAWAGYRALGQDYHEGCCQDRFEWDVILHGPVIGMTVRW